MGSIIVRVILLFISGLTPYLKPKDTIFIFGFKSNILSHPIISYCLQYLSLFFGGLILEFLFYKKYKDLGSNLQKRNKQLLSLYEDSKMKLPKNMINNEDNEENNDKKYFLRIFLIFSFYYFAKVAMISFDNLGYNRVKYWPLEFIFLLIFAKKILNRTMFRHQKLSLFTLIIVCTTIYVINSFIPYNNKDCSSLLDEEKELCEILNVNIYKDIINRFKWYFIPLIILIYLAAMVSNAYSSISFKWFMDHKYIKIGRILIYLGLIGFIYSLILLFILSNISCSKEKNNLLNDICKLDYQGYLFYENYKTLGDIEINSIFYLDIFILIPIYLISSFLYIFFELLIIKDLDPFYLIPIDSVYFLIYEIIDYCITFHITNLYRNLKFVCQVCSNIISIFLCSIYLEIIELHFCKLDLFLRKYIIERGEEERICSSNYIDEIGDLENAFENEE